jgi:hypothetical protein
MDLSRDIHPLADFKRNTAEFLTQLKQTGHPLVVTTGSHSWLFPLGEVMHSLACSRTRASRAAYAAPQWLGQPLELTQKSLKFVEVK